MKTAIEIALSIFMAMAIAATGITVLWLLGYGIVVLQEDYSGTTHDRVVELKLLDNLAREYEANTTLARTHCQHTAIQDFCQTLNDLWADYLNSEREEPLERLRKRSTPR